MGFPAFVAQLQIRRRWRSLVALAVFVAVVGGIAAALIAGSRRSSSVVRRYFDATIPYDVLAGGQTGIARAKVLAVPGVERADHDTYFASEYVRPDGTLGDGINGVVFDRSAIDPTIHVLAGRLPAASDASAILVNESFVQEFGLHPGDRLHVKTFARRDLPYVQESHYRPHGPEYDFRIAAVVRTPNDIALDETHSADVASPYASNTTMFVPSAFYDPNQAKFLTFGDAFDVQLAPSTSTAAFEAAMRRMFGDNVFFGPPRFAERRASFNTPVDLETGGLLALGIATAVAGAIVMTLLLGAERRAHEPDEVMLRSLGATRTQLGAIAALRTLPFAAGGAVFAVVIAIALSGRFPIGIGHLLELHPGLDVNAVVLAIGGIAVLTLTTATAFALERWPRRPTSSARTRAGGGLAGGLARSGAPVEIVIGTHLAFDSGTGRGASARPAIAGGAIALAVVIALGMFVGGTDHLYDDGTAHGWPWDAVIGNVNFSMANGRETKILHDARVSAATRARYGQATVGGISTEVLAFDPAGSAPPQMLHGRLPTHADEVAPGAKLLHELHATVGSTVKLSVADSEFLPPSGGHPVDRTLTVTGVALPPVLGESDFGEVAVVPISAIHAAGGVTDPQLVLTRLRGDPASTARALAKAYTPEILVDNIPARVVNLRRVRSLPVIGALLAALLGTVLLAYTLAVAVRRRLRQLGVLRALGMSGRRVGRVLFWQGIALALAITMIGIPLGLIAGSILWRTVAHQLGTSARAVVPPAVALLLPAAIVVGVLAAVVPARRARRQRVSELLRVE